MSSIFTEPTQAWLEITAETQAMAWQQSHSPDTPEHLAGAQWSVYLNQLCLQTLIPWLQTEFDVQATISVPANESPGAWELVSGSVIALQDKKWVFFPSESLGQDELLVPQEWIDIPSWQGDYYLAVKVNLADQSLEVWGYTTHKQIKEAGEYDSTERLYCLDADMLTRDLAVLETVRELEVTEVTRLASPSSEESSIPELASLSETQAQKLIQRLSNPNVAFPRLSIPFAQWGALLQNETWREQLYQARWTALVGVEEETGSVNDLGQWLQGAISRGWSSVEAVFGAQATQLAFGMRQDERPEIQQAKLIEFGSGPTVQGLRLVLLIQPEEDERLAIRAQLYPAEEQATLPEAVSLALVSTEGEMLQSVESRSSDNYIQLRRFRCSTGYEFRLEIRLAESSVSELFIT